MGVMGSLSGRQSGKQTLKRPKLEGGRMLVTHFIYLSYLIQRYLFLMLSYDNFNILKG